MLCPFCSTENRNERDTCYHCGKDLSMLRLLINKARHHYNTALEHAERNRYHEAITELKHAVELDSSLAEARLLLGTIYARMNRLEDARAEWERTLGLGRTQERAHRYLLDLKFIAPWRQPLRRLRVFLWASSAGFLLLVGGTIYLLRPAPHERELQAAWNAWEQNRLGEARRTLATLPRPLTDPSLELGARSLEAALDSEFSSVMREIDRLSAQEQTAKAVAVARAYLARVPPDREQTALVSLLEQFRSNSYRLARLRIAQLGDPGARLDRSRVAVEDFIALFPKDPQVAALREAYQQRASDYALATLRRIENDWRAGGASRAALSALAQLETEIGPDRTAFPPEFAERLVRLRDSLALNGLDDAIARAETHLLSGDLSTASVAIDEADLLAREAAASSPRRGSATSRVASLRESLSTRRLESRVGSLRAALNRQDWELALQITSDTLALRPPTVVAQELETGAQAARRARALQSYRWLLREAPRLESAAAESLDPAEARELLAACNRILSDLPFALYPEALDDALFFRIRAQRALGDEAGARESESRLRSERPQSRYLPKPS